MSWTQLSTCSYYLWSTLHLYRSEFSTTRVEQDYAKELSLNIEAVWAYSTQFPIGRIFCQENKYQIFNY